MKGLFITGTDTDAGKTTVTAALLRALKVAGVPAAAVKPVQTGCVMRGGEEENRGEGMGTPCRRERKTVLVAAVGKVVPVLPNT